MIWTHISELTLHFSTHYQDWTPVLGVNHFKDYIPDLYLLWCLVDCWICVYIHNFHFKILYMTGIYHIPAIFVKINLQNWNFHLAAISISTGTLIHASPSSLWPRDLIRLKDIWTSANKTSVCTSVLQHLYEAYSQVIVAATQPASLWIVRTLPFILS